MNNLKTTLKYILFVSIPLLFACQRDQVPQLNITLSTTESSKWQTAQIDIVGFAFYSPSNENPESVGVSNLQQWSGILLDQDLSESTTNLIALNEHWAIDLKGVKPIIDRITLIDTQTGELREVNIPYTRMIEIEPFLMMDNQTYAIDVQVNTDTVFKEENGAITFDWSEVSATIISQ